jgi:D-tyrosyl-tRNA(Tyr) deacylase
MHVLLQRVTSARVTVDAEIVGEIAHGLLALVCVEHSDDEARVLEDAERTAHLRIFEDDAGKMNRSVLDVGGGVLVVSQFTLAADTRKGRRPSFLGAAEPAKAEQLYLRFAARLRELGVTSVATGRFAADMKVALVNDGPVTIWLDPKS